MGRSEVIHIASPDQQEQAFQLRRAVFVAEQGVSEALEMDGRDAEALHLLALQAGRPVGTLRIRMLENGRIAKIERVAVAKESRGLDVGTDLMRAALDLASRRGAELVKLHAQTTVRAFYEKLGFAGLGDIFEEDGIPHIAMTLPLPGTAIPDRHQ